MARDMDQDATTLEVLDALSGALDDAISARLAERRGGEQRHYGDPPESAPIGVHRGEPPTAQPLGLASASLDAAHARIHADEEEPDRREPRTGWRPWMRRPPGS